MDHIIFGSFQEVVLPGAALQHGAFLLFEAADAVGGIQAEDAGIAAVLVCEGIVLVCVAVAHVRGGVVLAAHGERRGLVHDAGVEQEHRHHHQHDGNGAEGPAQVALFLFLGFLLLGKSLLVSTRRAGSLTVFLFSRCTHGLSHPLRLIHIMIRGNFADSGIIAQCGPGFK